MILFDPDLSFIRQVRSALLLFRYAQVALLLAAGGVRRAESVAECSRLLPRVRRVSRRAALLIGHSDREGRVRVADQAESDHGRA